MKIRRGLSEMNNPEDDLEAAGMLANEAHNTGHLANGSSGHTLAEQARAHSSSPRRIPLFERASARWWNPQFASATLETQYWKSSFPLLRDRFRSGLIYIILTCALWMTYITIFDVVLLHHWVAAISLLVLCCSMLWFTSLSVHYQRFYMPTSFLCVFMICLLTLLIFSSTHSFMGPVASMATSIQVVLLIYTVIPLPLYLCIIIGIIYSLLFELLGGNRLDTFIIPYGVKGALHACIHLLGIHLFILTQVRQRKTFLKVGQSLLARKDLELETQFKDHMIQSVMPKKVADELLKENSELRRPSASTESNCRTSNATTAGRSSAAESTAGIIANQQGNNNGNGAKNSVPNDVRKFRPFTMNLMTDVSILFADIAGFTKMSSNKSADELVNLLNDLFGRFDYLCGRCNLEKISTLGDCYYCVAGCPEPRPDHAKCCVEMGLAMIIAIRQFDMDRGQNVNMRVGIHTGKVMCGMVGTKRFKFDVFSNDVNLANEMESTGVAGRVHISEVTASYLDNQYVLEEAAEHKNMKTYFIAGRSKEFESVSNQFITVSDSESSREPTEAVQGNQQISFRKKLAGKLRTIQSTSLPISRQNTNSVGGGSLRMKLLDRTKTQTSSAQVLDQAGPQSQSMCAILPQPDPKKSTSLQALTNNYSGTNSIGPVTTTPGVGVPDRAAWSTIEQIGGKISMDLANGSSANNSGRGSRSSGLQDAGSDVHSVGGLDTAISHHHNAASLTRFDTENRDFDQRLAQIIQNSDGSFARGFWMHQDSLNRWTLKFIEKDIEEEYRAHFGDSCERQVNAKSPLIRHHQLDVRDQHARRPRYRYSGVFIDLLVSAIIFTVVSATMFLNIHPASTPYVIFCIIASIFLLIVIGLIGFPLLSRKSILPCVHTWGPRHILGCILIGLPVGVALFNISFCTEMYPPSLFCISYSQINKRLLYSYVLLISIYAHCNFSQLGAWPKTAQAIVVAVLFLVTTWICQFNLDSIRSFSDQSSRANFDPNQTWLLLGETIASKPCNHSQAAWSYGIMHSPLFIWELAVDVVLAVVLVAFLNYQFETSFRMSFFGDVQARRDTEKMQVVRDQADWLLTNIIPQHAVESLKTNTKYSENHAITAVLFASITNWNEMYEENFNGGREFLRVLNEVIADFDDLLERPEFNQVEKIKTIGATYMAASGLNPEKRRLASHPYEHLHQLIEFALALQNALDIFNQDLVNFEFVCKLGLNIGPVTAGVIGTTKLYYDIWGDTVNIASRMYSTGVENRIQVSQYTRDLLCDRYEFEYRDHIEVKGVDGGMDTYLLVGRKDEPPLFPSKISN
uniref:Guanylate cyclase domain-containing protein n=1 Tax=Panagrolaimus sp. JU765 TaxID=591449 RepID=A0AC34PUL0_9BILA